MIISNFLLLCKLGNVAEGMNEKLKRGLCFIAFYFGAYKVVDKG